MIQIALCDDNPLDLKKCADQIVRCADANHVKIQLSCYKSAEALLFDMCEFNRRMDILYMDILMEKTNGMTAAQTLRDFGSYAQIVFLTSTPDYMGQAFDVEAVQYLLKGKYTSQQFEQVFLRAVKQVVRRKEDLFVCEINSSMTSIPFRNILYFEVMDREIMLHHTNSKNPICFYGTMTQLEKDLSSKDFMRIHRSYMVHLPYLAKFGTQKIVLKDQTELPVGRNYMGIVKKQFCDYISQNHIYIPKGGLNL